MISGEEKAWEELVNLNPLTICKNAGVSYVSENGNYILKLFGMDFSISPQQKVIKNLSPEGDILLKKYGYFFQLSALCYLINAKDIPLSGRLVKPVDLKGGGLFFRGTHVLPLDKIAEKVKL